MESNLSYFLTEILLGSFPLLSKEGKGEVGVTLIFRKLYQSDNSLHNFKRTAYNIVGIAANHYINLTRFNCFNHIHVVEL
jgi:hypothetical protein